MCRFLADDVEGDHARVLTIHVADGQFVLRVAFQTGIPDKTHSRAGFQPPGNRHGNLTVLLHSQGCGDETAGNQPCVEGAEDPAVVDHGQFLDLIYQLCPSENAAAERVAVAVDVFRHAVDLKISAVAKRIKADGAGKGSIYAHDSSGGMGDLGNGIQIADPRGRISRHLNVDQFCVGPDCGTNGFGIRGVEECDFNVVFLGQILAKQQIGRAVADLGNDGVIPGVEKSSEDCSKCGNPACKDCPVFRTG